MLTSSEFRDLAEVPPSADWFANRDNANTEPDLRTLIKAAKKRIPDLHTGDAELE